MNTPQKYRPGFFFLIRSRCSDRDEISPTSARSSHSSQFSPGSTLGHEPNPDPDLFLFDFDIGTAILIL